MRNWFKIPVLAAVLLLPTAACAEPYRDYAWNDRGHYAPYRAPPAWRAPPVYRAPAHDWVHPQFGPSDRPYRNDSWNSGYRPQHRHRDGHRGGNWGWRGDRGWR